MPDAGTAEKPGILVMSPKFSVVIPTYNQADFLKVALRSVLDQTFQDFEVIVVNNHSTDHTLDAIAEAGDGRVEVINFENHGVIGAARNVGINASRGDYVAFLDSDDAWYPKKLEKVAEVIAADPNVGLVCHDQDIFRDGHKTTVARTGPLSDSGGEVYDYLLLRSNCVSTSSAVVARRYLAEVGNFSEDPGLATSEDYDLWLKLSRACRFHFIHEVLGVYNYHPAGASAKVELHLKSVLAVLEKHSNQSPIVHQRGFKRAIRRHYARAFYGAARQYHRTGDFKRTVAYYGRALRTYPLDLRTYGALTLLIIDLLMGQTRRRKVLQTIRPGSWLASWVIG